MTTDALSQKLKKMNPKGLDFILGGKRLKVNLNRKRGLLHS